MLLVHAVVDLHKHWPLGLHGTLVAVKSSKSSNRMDVRVVQSPIKRCRAVLCCAVLLCAALLPQQSALARGISAGEGELLEALQNSTVLPSGLQRSLSNTAQLMQGPNQAAQGSSAAAAARGRHPRHCHHPCAPARWPEPPAAL